MSKLLTSAGLMSGTSCDGIDASLIESDGENKINLITNHYFPYEKNFKIELKDLKKLINNTLDLKKFKKDIDQLENRITLYHHECIEELKLKIKSKKIDIIGIHGHTIYHSKKEKISLQLLNAKLLKEKIKTNFIYNFRNNDIAAGGEGAPLVPIFHKALRHKLNLNLPAIFINIGGISNITYIDINENLISFDCGPGNSLLDQYIQTQSGFNKLFDQDGEIACKHKYNEVILETYLNNKFYQLDYPKSLDVNDFDISGVRGLKTGEAVATLSELTVRSIIKAVDDVKNNAKKIILCGGGRKNKYFLNRIENLLKLPAIDINQFDIDGDYIESSAFAYLAIRSFQGKPITFPETTGVSKPLTGGDLF